MTRCDLDKLAGQESANRFATNELCLTSREKRKNRNDPFLGVLRGGFWFVCHTDVHLNTTGGSMYH